MNMFPYKFMYWIWCSLMRKISPMQDPLQEIVQEHLLRLGGKFSYPVLVQDPVQDHILFQHYGIFLLIFPVWFPVRYPVHELVLFPIQDHVQFLILIF